MKFPNSPSGQGTCIHENLKLSALLALLLIASAGSLRAAPTRITSSQTITVPGSYVLANDIAGGISIQASDVTLNLNGHSITNGGIGITYLPNTVTPVLNVRVSNGKIVNGGVSIYGSECTVTGLNITVPQGGYGITIEHGPYNHVSNCVLTGQDSNYAFSLFLTSHNTIQNCTLVGTFRFVVDWEDQAGAAYTSVGDNNFSGIQWANPTL